MKSVLAAASEGIISTLRSIKHPTYSFNGRHGIGRHGGKVTIWDHKKHLKSAKVYPYSNTRQNTRQQRKGDRDMLTAMSY